LHPGWTGQPNCSSTVAASVDAILRPMYTFCVSDGWQHLDTPRGQSQRSHPGSAFGRQHEHQRLSGEPNHGAAYLDGPGI
jgi:hypothetical protein